MSNQFRSENLAKASKVRPVRSNCPLRLPQGVPRLESASRSSNSTPRGPQEASQISQIKVRSKSNQFRSENPAKASKVRSVRSNCPLRLPQGVPRLKSASRGSNWRPEASRGSNRRPEASRGSNRRPEAQIGVPRHTGRVQSHGQTKARLKPTGFFCISLKGMVQTKDGAAANPWLVYMRACAAAYKAERAQQQEAAGASKAPLVESTPKRRTRKPKVTAHRHSAGVQSHGQGPGGAFSETTPEKSTGAGAPL